jgi:hypothetical protein
LFENPDYVAIVIHNYRWRLGLADGERQYDALEAKLEAGPVISVPSITMEGDSNGAPHAPAVAYRAKFSGKYEYRLIAGGIGHNCRKKHRKPSPKPSSTSQRSNPAARIGPAGRTPPQDRLHCASARGDTPSYRRGWWPLT